MKVHTVKTQRERHSQSVIAESYSLKCPYFAGLDSASPVCASRHGRGRGYGRLRRHGGCHCHVARPVGSVVFPAAHHQWCHDPVITVGEHPKSFVIRMHVLIIMQEMLLKGRSADFTHQGHFTGHRECYSTRDNSFMLFFAALEELRQV